MNEKKKFVKENDYQIGTGADFTCAKFGTPSCSILAAGDDQNNLMLWRLTNTKPKLILTGQTSFASSIEFSQTATKLFSGTNGGTVHIWDLQQASELVKLKGHTAPITAIAGSNSDQFLVTGSGDTKVKLWDQRVNSCVASFREHSNQVNTLMMSPDAKWVASGSSDGSLKIWDITADRVLANFAFDAQRVTCLQFNPSTLTLANGSSDGTVRYWDLERMSNITQTSRDSTPVSHICFSSTNAEHLFAASADHIRLWNIESNQQLDCLSVLPSKKITDLKVATQHKYLLMSCMQANTLSVYYSKLDNLNFDDSVDTVPSQQQVGNVVSRTSEPIPSSQPKKTESVNVQSQIAQAVDVVMKQEPVQPQRYASEKVQNVQNNQQPSFQQQQQQQSQQLQNQTPVQVQIPQKNMVLDQPVVVQSKMPEPQNQDEDMKDLRQTYIPAPKKQPVGLQIQDFMTENMMETDQDGDMQRDIRIIEEIDGQHRNFAAVIQKRYQSIQVINKYFTDGNVHAAVNFLGMTNDISVVQDVMNNTFAMEKKIELLNYEQVSFILPIAGKLVGAKYENYIDTGLKSIMNILKGFAPQIIQLKTVPVSGGVDLAREERVAKCDSCIDKFAEFNQSKQFQKALNRQGIVRETAGMLQNQLQHFLQATGRQ